MPSQAGRRVVWHCWGAERAEIGARSPREGVVWLPTPCQASVTVDRTNQIQVGKDWTGHQEIECGEIERLLSSCYGIYLYLLYFSPICCHHQEGKSILPYYSTLSFYQIRPLINFFLVISNYPEHFIRQTIFAYKAMSSLCICIMYVIFKMQGIQPVHDVRTTLYGRWYDVKTLKRSPYNVVRTSCAVWV